MILKKSGQLLNRKLIGNPKSDTQHQKLCYHMKNVKEF